MTTERDKRMMEAALFLAKAPYDKIPTEELNLLLDHGNLIGGFICGVRWADKNPESPWVHVDERMPEDSLPKLSDEYKNRRHVKVFLRMKNGRIMEAERRMGSDDTWYFNTPLCMRDQITHWMPVPPIPTNK